MTEPRTDLETDAVYCADVYHVHNHGACNGRCWGSWADPDNCPEVCADSLLAEPTP